MQLHQPGSNCFFGEQGFIAKMNGVEGLPVNIVINACEALLARSQPYEERQIVLGGVHLKLFVTNHWAGFDRYMLIGQDWQAGFNLRIPDDGTDDETFAQVHMYGSPMEIFGVGIEGQDAFYR